ncbi:MAG: hypothetical protein IGS48_08480 [Oscillatoriales cyanobacterium C42_A2020_001]|nr:hypothetical protein [Leptolyngbyaceae cyanobacterium C42_A2020_001]
MARKRLSDLLREEANKPADGGAETGADEQAAIAQPTSSNSSKNNPTKISETPSSKATSSPANAALNSKIAELQQALETAKQHENDLKHQVTDLKADLKTQTAATKKLQTQLETVEQRNHQLETELAEAKQTVLQLADGNSQLKQEIDSLKHAHKPTTLAAPSKPATPAVKSNESAQSLAARPLTQQEILRRRQADSLAHPVFPTTDKSPGHLSEQDMGWVD